MVLAKYIRANYRAPLFMLVWQGAFSLVGLCMVLAINTFINEDANYACMGTLFVLCGTAVGTFARGNLSGNTRFSLAVSMGQTRRSYFLLDSCITFFIGAIGVAVSWLVYQLESRLYAVLYPGFVDDMPLDGIFRLKYLLPAVVLLVVLELVFTAVTIRFGPNTFRVIWLVFCLSFMVVPGTVDAYVEGSGSLFARIGGIFFRIGGALSAKGWIGVGCAAVLGLLIFAVRVFRRAEVKL